MKIFELVVKNKVGLHARPAALFVQTANKYQSSIKVRNLTNEHGFVDAKSILGILTLGVSQNHRIEIKIDGEDELKAAEEIRNLIENDFEGLQ